MIIKSMFKKLFTVIVFVAVGIALGFGIDLSYNYLSPMKPLEELNTLYYGESYHLTSVVDNIEFIDLTNFVTSNEKVAYIEEGQIITIGYGYFSLYYKSDFGENIFEMEFLIKFKNKSLNDNIGNMTNGDNYTNEELIETVRSLEFKNDDIDSELLKQLELFVNLESLTINGSNLTTLDLSTFVNLKRLDLSNNSNLVNINNLDQLKKITNVDISNSKSIIKIKLPSSVINLKADNTKLNEIKIDGKASLTTLSLKNLESQSIELLFDLSNITLIDLTDSKINSLILDNDAPKLDELLLTNSTITSLSIKEHNLSSLIFRDSNLLHLNLLGNNKSLKKLIIANKDKTILNMNGDLNNLELLSFSNIILENDLSLGSLVKEIYITNSTVDNFDFLDNTVNIDTLKLVSVELTKLNLNKEYKFLEHIDLHDNYLEDVDFIEFIPNLTVLYLGNNLIETIDIDERFNPKMQLELINNPIKTINYSLNLDDLERFFIESEDLVTLNIYGDQDVTELNDDNFYTISNNLVINFKADSSFDNLETITLEGYNYLEFNFEVVFPVLKTLLLINNGITNFVLGESFPSLEILDLTNNDISAFSLEYSYDSNTIYNLKDNPIQVVNFINTFSNISNFHHNSSNVIFNVNDSSELDKLTYHGMGYEWELRIQALPNLKELDLSNSKLTDFVPESSLDSLHTLNLSRNYLTRFDHNEFYPALKNLNLEDNYIKFYNNYTYNSDIEVINLNNNSNLTRITVFQSNFDINKIIHNTSNVMYFIELSNHYNELKFKGNDLPWALTILGSATVKNIDLKNSKLTALEITENIKGIENIDLRDNMFTGELNINASTTNTLVNIYYPNFSTTKEIKIDGFYKKLEKIIIPTTYVTLSLKGTFPVLDESFTKEVNIDKLTLSGIFAGFNSLVFKRSLNLDISGAYYTNLALLDISNLGYSDKIFINVIKAMKNMPKLEEAKIYGNGSLYNSYFQFTKIQDEINILNEVVEDNKTAKIYYHNDNKVYKSLEAVNAKTQDILLTAIETGGNKIIFLNELYKYEISKPLTISSSMTELQLFGRTLSGVSIKGNNQNSFELFLHNMNLNGIQNKSVLDFNSNSNVRIETSGRVNIENNTLNTLNTPQPTISGNNIELVVNGTTMINSANGKNGNAGSNGNKNEAAKPGSNGFHGLDCLVGNNINIHGKGSLRVEPGNGGNGGIGGNGRKGLDGTKPLFGSGNNGENGGNGGNGGNAGKAGMAINASGTLIISIDTFSTKTNFHGESGKGGNGGAGGNASKKVGIGSNGKPGLGGDGGNGGEVYNSSSQIFPQNFTNNSKTSQISRTNGSPQGGNGTPGKSGEVV